MIDTPEFYVGLAVAALILVFFLLRTGEKGTSEDAISKLTEVPFALSSESLQIIKRILDRSDYLWLRDGLKKPNLAHELKKIRTLLVLQWLSDLQDGFRQLVRSVRENPQQAVQRGLPADMKIAWHTFSFFALIIFAKFSVSIFGPFTRTGGLLWPARYLQSLRNLIPSSEMSRTVSEN